MHPLRLNTKYGVEQYDILAAQLLHYKKIGAEEEFKLRCQQDWQIQSDYLGFFLENDEMEQKYPMNEDDIDNFKLFNEQSDVCTCLRYFGGGVM